MNLREREAKERADRDRVWAWQHEQAARLAKLTMTGLTPGFGSAAASSSSTTSTTGSGKGGKRGVIVRAQVFR